MLTQTTYKVEEYNDYAVFEITRTEPDWKESKKLVFEGNLSDCYAYIRLKETGQL